MWVWLNAHSSGLQTLFSGAMVVIWIAYLQVFLIGFQRQHRPDIMINMGAGVGLKARCFVSNLSLEPIYLFEVIVEVETGSGTYRTAVTDRTELPDRQLRDPAEATNQGPLKSGDYIDIGDFKALIDRASSPDVAPDVVTDLRSIELTIVAATAVKASLIGARRTYVATTGEENQIRLRPTTIAATQITTRAGRRKLKQEVEQRLAS